MTDFKTSGDPKQGFDENCLVDRLVPGPRKSDIFVQFMGRINRRIAPLPAIVHLAPTGKAHAQLQRQVGQSAHEAEVQNVNEELDPGILKPKFR
ncbi:hypothetical protein [Rhizobium sp. MHM7A]|uniref:hypothetical protein n=1 Tax=Rhizobium sp. MHM7A TaxID=2583233 RepID=UPI001106AA83|nr:hypothetical protein [Rhizobium sp. MHM7A]TLX15945.1 hypothetical protein FFR93_01110 [Rhizobium sp. MHM7A]